MVAITKPCRRCKEKLLLNKDNFYPRKNIKSGFRPYCIKCCKDLAKTDWGRTSREAKDRKNYARKYDISQRANALLSAYRRSDAKKGYDFNIDKLFIIELLKLECVYCGDKYMPNLGLDRIDNNKGHIKSNVVTCCYQCNTARSDSFSFDEMKEIGNVIRDIKLRRNFPVHSVIIPIGAVS